MSNNSTIRNGKVKFIVDNDVLRCDCNIIHEDVVEKVRKQMPQDEKLYDLAELFKVLGDTTRVRILFALDKSEMCVCDISVLLNMTKSAVSHQLRSLKEARLVKYRKQGRNVYYSLDDGHVKSIFKQGMTHIEEEINVKCDPL